MINLKTEITDLKTKIADINTKINILILKLILYFIISNRFYFIYWQDIFSFANNKDCNIILFSNKKLYTINIIIDKKHFENKTQFDNETFKDFYKI